MAKNYQTGLIITGDATGAIKATQLTEAALARLNGATGRANGAWAEQRRQMEQNAQAAQRSQLMISGMSSSLTASQIAGAALAAKVGYSAEQQANMLRNSLYATQVAAQSATSALSAGLQGATAHYTAAERQASALVSRMREAKKEAELLASANAKASLSFNMGAGQTPRSMANTAASNRMVSGMSASAQPDIANTQAYAVALADLNRHLQAGIITNNQYSDGVARVRQTLAGVRPTLESILQAQEQFRQSGAALSQSLQTPAQTYAATVANLRQHLNAAHISQDQFNLGLQQARAALDLTDTALQQVLRDQRRFAQEGANLSASLVTPTQRYANEIANLRAHLAAGHITQSQFNLGLQNARNAMSGTSSALGYLKNMMMGYISLVTLHEYVNFADSWVNLNNRIGLTTQTTAQAVNVQQKLFDITQKTRMGFEGTVQLYSKMALAAESLGVSQSRLLGITSSVNKAIALSGADKLRGDAAILQLSQSLSSNRLSGDEYRSLTENAPRIIKAIADGIGVTTGELRKLSSEGVLTTEIVMNALESQTKKLNAEFAKMKPTIGQAFAVLHNEVLKFIGEGAEASGTASNIADGITLIAKNLKTIADVFQIAAFAAAPVLLRGIAAGIVAITGAMALNPVTAWAVGLTAAFGFLYTTISNKKAEVEALLKPADTVEGQNTKIQSQVQKIAGIREGGVSSLERGDYESQMSYLNQMVEARNKLLKEAAISEEADKLASIKKIEGLEEETLKKRKEILDSQLTLVKENSGYEVEVISAKIAEIDRLYQDGTVSAKEYFSGKTQMIAQEFETRRSALKEQIALVNKELEGIKDISPALNIKVDAKGLTEQIKTAVSAASAKYGIEESLLKGLISHESRFRVDAVSGAGAVGLTQVMPKNFEHYKIPKELWFDIPTNIDTGSRLLAEEIKRFDGNIKLALAAYNAGAPAVIAAGNKIPNFKETQNYVPDVLLRAKAFQSGNGFQASVASETAQKEAQKQILDLTTKRVGLQNELNLLHYQESAAIGKNTSETYKFIEANKKLSPVQEYEKEIALLKERRELSMGTPKQMTDTEYGSRLDSITGKLQDNLKYIKEFQDVRDNAEAYTKFSESLAIIDKLLEDGRISQPLYNQSLDAIKEHFAAISPEAKQAAEQTKQFNSIIKQMDEKVLSLNMDDKTAWVNGEVEKLGGYAALAAEKVDMLRQKWDEVEAAKQRASSEKQFDSIISGMDKKISKAGLDDKSLWVSDQIESLGGAAEVSAEKVGMLRSKWEQLNNATQRADMIRTLKDGFINGVDAMLDKTKSFGEALFSIIDAAAQKILNQSLNKLWNGFEDLFNGVSGGWAKVFEGAVGVGFSALTSWLSDSGKADKPSLAQTSTNKNILGLDSMAIADKGGRATYEASMLPTIQSYNRSLNLASTLIRNNADTIVNFGAKMLGSLSQSVLGGAATAAISKFVDGIKGAYSSVMSFGKELVGGVGKIIGGATSSTSASFESLLSAAGIAFSASPVASEMALQISGYITPTLTNAVSTASAEAGAQIATSAGEKIGTQISDYLSSGISNASMSSSGAATNAAQSGSGAGSSAAGAAGTVIALVGLAYNLFEIAGQKFTSTLNKVSQGFYAAESAAVSILGVANPIAWIVGGILRVAGAVTQMASGDWMGGASNLLGGHIGGLLADLMKEKPSASILAGNNSMRDPGATDSATGDYYTSHSRDSATVGLLTSFGHVEMRLNAVGDNWKAVMEEAVNNFLPLLKTTQAFDQALATSINITDELNNQDRETLGLFQSTFKPVESDFKLEGLDSSKMITFRMDAIAKALGETGTKAGEAVSAWWGAFSKKLLDPSKGQQYNTITTFNIETFLAAKLPQLAELPQSLADLFVQSVKSVSDGATQEQFQAQMDDFFTGWVTAKEGLKQVGIAISDTAIPEYLSSLVDLGLGVGDAANTLVAYAQTFQYAAGNVTEEFNKAFNKIFDDAKKLGQSKEQTSGYISSYVALAGITKDLGIDATANQLDSVAKSLNSTAQAGIEAANAAIDKKIAEAGLSQVSREAAIQQLALAGTITDAEVAAASFSSALVKAQREMFDGIDFATQTAALYMTTVSGMGLSFDTLTGLGTGLTQSFGDLAKAMEFIDTMLKSVLSEQDYATAKQNAASMQFDAAKKSLGLGESYNIEDFKKGAADPLNAGYFLQLGGSTDPKDKATFESFKQLVQAGEVLIGANEQVVQAQTAAGSSATSLADKTKALADLQKQVDDELRTINMTDFAKGIDDINTKIADLAAQAAEAGGSIANLGALQNAQIVKYLKGFTDPITSAFNDIGKTDTQKSIAKIKDDLKGILANISEAAKQGLADKGSVNLYTNQATANAVDQAKQVFKPLVDEFMAIGKSDYQKSLEGITQWADDMKLSASDIALAYGITTKDAIAGINQIANARLEALQKEMNATIKKSALDESRAQQNFGQRNSPDVQSLSGTLNGIVDSYSQTILSLAANGATLKQMMPTYNAALASGARATQLAIESVAKAYAAIYKQINDVNNTIGDKILGLQGGDVTGAQKARAMADLNSDNLDTQLAAVQTLMGLTEQKYANEIKLATYLNGLLLSAASPLSNVQQRDLAKSNYEKNLKGAQGGDQTSIDNLGSSFDAYLEQQKKLSVTKQDYAEVFQRGMGDIEKLAGGNKGSLEERAKQAALDQVKELQKLQSILTGTNGILAQQKDKQRAVEDSLAAAALAAKSVFDAILLGNKDVTNAIEKDKVKPTIYDAFIQQISDSLAANGFTDTQVSSIRGGLQSVATDITNLLAAGKIDPAEVALIEADVSGLVANVSDALLAGRITQSQATDISTSTLGFQHALLTALGTGTISQAAMNDIGEKEAGFRGSVFDYLSNGTISGADASAILKSRNTLNISLLTAINNGTMTTGDAQAVYEARNAATANLATFLATAHLSPADQSLIISGFSTMSTNTQLVLGSIGLTGEQIALISLGYGDSAAGVHRDLAALHLTPDQIALYDSGVGIFSTNVKDGVAGISPTDAALGSIYAGVDALALNMHAGLSSVAWLQQPGDTVYAGIMSLATHIGDGLAATDWLQPAAAVVQNGINTLASNIANYLASVKPTNGGSTYTPAPSASTPAPATGGIYQGIISSTPGIDALKAGDLNGAIASARLSGLFTEAEINGFVQLPPAGMSQVISDLTRAGKTFATGGYYPGGMALVGEQGPELINFDSPGQVYTAPQTRNLMNGGNNEELAAEIRALREEIKAIQNENRQLQIKIVTNTKKSADFAEKNDVIGMPPVRT